MATGNKVEVVRSPKHQAAHGASQPVGKTASLCSQCEHVCYYPVVAVQKYAKISVFCSMSCFAKHASETL